MIIQGTSEWFQERIGYATASNFGAVLAGGEGLTRSKYKARIVAELRAGKPIASFSNDFMRNGNELEPFARAAYMGRTGNNVKKAGFIKHESLRAGASPDGFVGDDGLVEIKCVIETVQMETINSNKMPSIHIPQVQGQLWITKKKWCDFASFCDGMDGNERLFITRVYRDEEYIKNLEVKVSKFMDEVLQMEKNVIENCKVLSYETT